LSFVGVAVAGNQSIVAVGRSVIAGGGVRVGRELSSLGKHPANSRHIKKTVRIDLKGNKTDDNGLIISLE